MFHEVTAHRDMSDSWIATTLTSSLELSVATISFLPSSRDTFQTAWILPCHHPVKAGKLGAQKCCLTRNIDSCSVSYVIIAVFIIIPLSSTIRLAWCTDVAWKSDKVMDFVVANEVGQAEGHSPFAKQRHGKKSWERSWRTEWTSSSLANLLGELGTMMLFSTRFSTGSASPVNDFSSQLRFMASKIRRSAGTVSPVFRITMSPGTTSALSRLSEQ